MHDNGAGFPPEDYGFAGLEEVIFVDEFKTIAAPVGFVNVENEARGLVQPAGRQEILGRRKRVDSEPE